MSNNIPLGAIPWSATALGTTAAISVSSPTNVGRTGYIAGFSFSGTNATAAQNGTVAVTNLAANTGAQLFFSYPTIAGGTTIAPPAPLTVTFNPALPCSAMNTAIIVSGPALGTGAAACSINAWGYLI